jgi:hypothetical protein
MHQKKTQGGGAMGMKGILYQLYDYPFTYLLYRPSDKRAVVLVEDGLYAMQSRRPRLKIFPDDPVERTLLTVLPFWIYPSKQLLNRARKLLEIDAETTEKIFKYAERAEIDDYCIEKMKELASENTAGIFQIVEEAERGYAE